MHVVKNRRGDTIIEVLIAVAIAGSAIGTSYAIAHKAMQKAVSARERDQAVGLLESQVAALKVRHQDPTTFSSNFVPPAGTTYHFCLDTASTGSGDTTHKWGRQDNLAATPLAAPATGYSQNINTAPYNPVCAPSGSNGTFYIDISTARDGTSSTPTNYRLDVRWPKLGGGADNDATFYYRF